MTGELIDLLILLILICAVFWVLLWFVRNNAPQFIVPAQILVAVIAIIIFLVQLKKFLPALLS